MEKVPVLRRLRALKSQRGFTLLEVLLAVSIGSLVLSSGASFMMDRVNDVKDQTTAQYQVKIAGAAERYIRDNLTTVASGLGINGAAAPISVATLRGAGYLSTGMTDINPYRQTACVLVRRLTNNTLGQPRLEALIVTEGGIAIPDKRVPFIAAMGGSVGGYVPPTAPTTAQGAYGVWSQNLGLYSMARCSGSTVSANRLAYAIFFDGSTSAGGVNADDVLHRVAVAGRPDLNRMNVALDMGGNDINTARNITASGSVRASGDVAGNFVYATSDSTGYGQTLLRRWGLSNNGGSGAIYIEPQPGAPIYLTDQWAKSGTLSVQMGRQEMMYGHTQFSRNGVTECCGDQGTIGLAENTNANNRESGINFHNSGWDEGNLVLANRRTRGGSRRLLAYDNQGQRMGLEATGDITTYGGNMVTSNANFTNIVYDYYNNGYYLQPRSTSRLNYTVTDNDYTYGWKQADIYYDRYNNGYYAQLRGTNRLNYTVTDNDYTYGWKQADVYYDRYNTGYYVQARSWSRLAGVNANTIYLQARGRYVENLLPYHVHIGSFRRAYGGTVPAPSCPNGGSAKIQLTPLQMTMPHTGYYRAIYNNTSAMVVASEQNMYASWAGWGWYVYFYVRQVYWDGVSYYWLTSVPYLGSSTYAGLGIAHIYCWYP